MSVARSRKQGGRGEAILEYLEDLEDLYLAERTLERIRSGEERIIPLKKAMKRHGLRRRTG